MSCSDTDTPTDPEGTTKPKAEPAAARPSSACPSTPRSHGASASRTATTTTSGRSASSRSSSTALLEEMPEGARAARGGCRDRAADRAAPRAGRATHGARAVAGDAPPARGQATSPSHRSLDRAPGHGRGPAARRDATTSPSSRSRPRRGIGLLRLLHELASRVRDRVVMLLDEDSTVRLGLPRARGRACRASTCASHLVDDPRSRPADQKRAVLMVADVRDWTPQLPSDDAWVFESRTLEVPYPAPRGAATRLVRYFLTGGERALLVRTHEDGRRAPLRQPAHRRSPARARRGDRPQHR